MKKVKQIISKNELLFLNEVEKQNNNFEDAGLINGRLGNAIVYYLLAKQYQNNSYSEKGLELLEWISDTGVSSGDLSFSNGLTGVGWAIEWLAQNELMEETNTDDVLEPIDDILYKTVSYVKDDNLTLANGTLGKIAYFLKRAASHNPGTHRYKTVGHLECIILLLDDLSDKMNGAWKPEDNLTELGNILCYISSIKVKVNSPTSGKIMYDSVNNIEKMLSDLEPDISLTEGSIKEKYLNLLYLGVCYLVAANNRNNKYWRNQALGHIERIDDVINDIGELTIAQLFRKLTLYSLIYVYQPEERYGKKMEKLIELLSFDEMAPGIVNGRGALVISELILANPTLVSNWNEVMLL